MRRRAVLHIARRASSKSDLIRGARVLTTPKESEQQQAGTTSAKVYKVLRAQYICQQEQSQDSEAVDDATARILKQQQARRGWLADLYAAGEPTHGAGGVTTNSFYDAKIAQMEREGQFKNLKGTGEPLPHRHQSHYGDEDAVDRMMHRIMAEQKCIPESLERRKEYLAKYKEFRETLERSGEVQGGGRGPPLKRAKVEAEMAHLRALLSAFDSASVKDALLYNMPITKCPKVATTLDEEIAAARHSTRRNRDSIFT